MKLAIMQPYFFPYIGYLQLINAADVFLIYDDVNFIKGGWINRNRIISDNGPIWINVLLEQPSSFVRICDTKINKRLDWKSKLCRKIEYTYKKAPYFNEVFPIVTSVLQSESESVSQIASKSINAVSEYLGFKTKFSISSELNLCSNFTGAERVKEICIKFGAEKYINLSGGIELYDKKDFKKSGIDLLFLKTEFIKYNQFNYTFTPGLSIIDIMMFNSKETIISEHMKSYSIL